MGPWMMGSWFGWPLMFLFPLLFLGLIIFLVYSFVSASSSTTSTRSVSAQASAIDILNERYARGEITEDQYLKMKAQLKS